jgi:hypothetical protein
MSISTKYNWKTKYSHLVPYIRMISIDEFGFSGTYNGVEFGSGVKNDWAHQFCNVAAYLVGKELKEQYKNGQYVKVNFSNIRIVTSGMDMIGDVQFNIYIPFMSVASKCEAYTSFDHAGGWGHAPALQNRLNELQSELLPGDSFDVSDLTDSGEPNGLEEYWIQWRNKVTQKECQTSQQSSPSGSSQPISNNKGDIQLNLPQHTSDPENATVTFQKDGYQNVTINPYNQAGALQSLPIIEFKDNETALQETINEVNVLDDEQVDELLKDKQTPEWFAQKRIGDIATEKLQKILIPLVLKQIMVRFGVSDPLGLLEQIKNIKEQGQSYIEENQNLSKEEKKQQLKETAQTGAVIAGTAALAMGKDKAQQEIMNLIQKNLGGKSMCPSPGTLSDIIKIKNSVTTQLNQVMNLLNTNTQILGITSDTISFSEIALIALKFSPIPIPPGAPVSLVGLIEDSKEFLDKDIIKKLKAITSGTLSILLLVRQVLTKVLQLLELLDHLIQFCSPNTIEFEQELSQELQNILTQQTIDDFPVPIKIINGFTMEIETETTENPTKRRRAIARDAGGVAVLKGEWSFSSTEQILIDELVFYIQSNNLKST